MMENSKGIEKELRAIKFLLAGMLLKRNPNIKEVAKVIGCSDNTLTALYPGNKSKKNLGSKTKGQEGLNEKTKIESS